MKKGQKVRILRTNQIATIAEIELIRKGCKVHQYCRLKLDKEPDLWLDASELGSLIEYATVTIKGENGKLLKLKADRNYLQQSLNMELQTPGDKDDRGLHILLMQCLLDGISRLPEPRP